MITCVLLSAGLSERFGSPKELAPLLNNNCIEHVQNTLLQSSCDRIIVVLGAYAEQIQPSIFIHRRIRVVYNKDYNFGQTSSVQTGWREADKSSMGIILLPVDCPLVQTSTINRIIEDFKEHDPDILIPTYLHKKGHPPVFHQRLRSKILGLSMDQGLNSLFAEHPPQVLEINDRGIIKSFNTIQELENIKNNPRS